VQTWLDQQLKPGHVFFDVGSHHGWDSMWALPLVGSAGSVVSFEPSPANLSILRWHNSRNHFPQWTIVPKAVSDINAQKEFFLVDSGDSPMNSLTTGGPGTPFMSGRDIRKTAMQTITVDAFCSEFGRKPDVVKIDVEGAELLVLYGATELLREHCPTIILAVHPSWLPVGHSPEQLFRLLTDLGYRIHDAQGCSVQYLQEGEYLCLNSHTETPQ
jgi:FkbM family methyltransferase